MTVLRSDTPALDIAGLAFSYGGRFALQDVSFAVPPGAFTALLGPNGAGKTTLFSLITHLFTGGRGTIRIGGWDIRRESRKALAQMGVVFQQPTLDLDLTVVQNLRYFASLHAMPTRTADQRIEAELARLELWDRRDDRVRHLSGGYRRRVEVARALLHRPSLLLLDEATVGLDVPTRRRIVDQVHALARDDGIAVLWATHLIDEVRADDDVVVMHGGRVKARGRVDEVARAAGCETIGEAFARMIAADPEGEGGGERREGGKGGGGGSP
ncbi:MAG: ATP-binding cassette domain-containing protein [Rhodospirillales bacterium]|nr:ATP-binding cassette domain-containing protein [Rhodospirillales bacterium]